MKYKGIVPIVAMCAVIGAIAAIAIGGCTVAASEGGAVKDACGADGHCANSLHCFANRCRANGQSAGVGCSANDQCASGLSCLANQCSDMNAGSACDANDQCASGLSCLVNQCSDMSAGSSCDANDQCADGLHCFDDVCRADGQSAEVACSADTQCASGLCFANLCNDMSEGSACSTIYDSNPIDDRCADGLHCFDGVCRADGQSEGESCDTSYDNQCASGLSCVTRWCPMLLRQCLPTPPSGGSSMPC